MADKITGFVEVDEYTDSKTWERRGKWLLGFCIIVMLPLIVTGWFRPVETIPVATTDCADEHLTIRDLSAAVKGKQESVDKAAKDLSELREDLSTCRLELELRQQGYIGDWLTETEQ